MKNISGLNKRLAAGAAAAAMLMTGAYAAGGASIIADGTKIEGAQTYVVEDKTYVPVRKLCEQLGMTVEWDAENEKVTIVDLPVYIRFSPDEDGFTFARTAPMMLGTAPFCENGTTYVPLNFIDEILQASYTVEENGDVVVNYATDNMHTVQVLEKISENGVNSLKVSDKDSNDEIIVNFTEDTQAYDKDGLTVKFEDIAKDAMLKIEYSETMTLSLPPITNAVRIDVLEAAAE